MSSPQSKVEGEAAEAAKPPVYQTVKDPPDHEPVHCLPWGLSGSGKSELAASFPTPMLLLLADPKGQEAHYLRRGRPTKWFDTVTRYVVKTQAGDQPRADVTPTRLIYHPTEDVVIIRVEQYFDEDATKPEAWMRYVRRMSNFKAEYNKWATTVVDSLSMLMLGMRNFSEFILNTSSAAGKEAHGMRHHGYAATQVWQQIINKLGNAPMNVVVTAHVDKQRDEIAGKFIYNPAAPGQLSEQMPGAFGEMYYCDTDANGIAQLQTRRSPERNAASRICRAPNPCVNNYTALWAPKKA